MMDVVNRFLILTLLIALASAQINFSTGWGKRSPTSMSAAVGLASLPMRHHSATAPDSIVPLPSNQQQTDSSYRNGYTTETEDQRIAPLPSPCLSLLKSLLLVNKIAEVSRIVLFVLFCLLTAHIPVGGRKKVARWHLVGWPGFSGSDCRQIVPRRRRDAQSIYRDTSFYESVRTQLVSQLIIKEIEGNGWEKREGEKNPSLRPSQSSRSSPGPAFVTCMRL